MAANDCEEIKLSPRLPLTRRKLHFLCVSGERFYDSG